jgi:hypothetical protein
LRSGVTKAHRYEPDLNPTYLEMATHYGVAIVPARVRKPKAEVGVQIAERWILASLRNHSFFSLTDLHQTIQQLLLKLKQRSFKKLPGSRSELFQSLDKPALKTLPMTPYVYAEWKLRGVAIFAKAFMVIPAQQAAKTTRPLMPAAAPAVLLHSLHTQQGVCNIVTQ